MRCEIHKKGRNKNWQMVDLAEKMVFQHAFKISMEDDFLIFFFCERLFRKLGPN